MFDTHSPYVLLLSGGGPGSHLQDPHGRVRVKAGFTPATRVRNTLIRVAFFQVVGLGPTFRIRVELSNTSATAPILDLALAFNYDEKLYRLQRNFIKVCVKDLFRFIVFKM